MTPEHKHDLAVEGLKALPSIAAIATWLADLTVEKWLGIAGILFIVLQALGYAWRLHRDMRNDREERASKQSRHDLDHS